MLGCINISTCYEWLERVIGASKIVWLLDRKAPQVKERWTYSPSYLLWPIKLRSLINSDFRELCFDVVVDGKKLAFTKPFNEAVRVRNFWVVDLQIKPVLFGGSGSSAHSVGLVRVRASSGAVLTHSFGHKIHNLVMSVAIKQGYKGTCSRNGSCDVVKSLMN